MENSNKLIIEFNGNAIQISSESPTTLEQIILLCLQTIQVATEQVCMINENNPEFHTPEFRRTIYDMVNTGTGNLLKDIDPSASQHPNLSEVAILLAENTLMDNAEAQGLTLEEYLPQAKKDIESDFRLFKMNQEGARRKNRKKAKLSPIEYKPRSR